MRPKQLSPVMPTLVAGINASLADFQQANVDDRDKTGHDSRKRFNATGTCSNFPLKCTQMIAVAISASKKLFDGFRSAPNRVRYS
jgi:hypothetical protein